MPSRLLRHTADTIRHMDWVYLDNNATTQPAPQVAQAIQETVEQFWANPSSVHRFGQAVRQRIELARAKIAFLIGCRPRDLVFTSGGTESNNLALRGVLDRTLPGRHRKQPSSRGVLITTRTEHAAIRETAQQLADLGVQVVYVPVNCNGLVNPQDLTAALNEHATGDAVPLVSIHWANNETGAVQQVDALATACQAHQRDRGGPRVILHVDATQAVGKIPVDVGCVPIDLLTLSAHKFHGPKGIGALYIRGGLRLIPQMLGGPQEMGRRGGTENAPGIVGFGVAADLATPWLNNHDQIAHLTARRDRFEQAVCANLPQTVIHCEEPGPTAPPRLWNTSNLGFPRLEAEAILLGLSEQGLCASAGAACSSGSLEPSPVLLAMGIPQSVAHGSVRFSLSRYSTDEEIDRAVAIIRRVVDKLMRITPMTV